MYLCHQSLVYLGGWVDNLQLDLLIQKRENGTVIDFSKDPYEVSLVANVPYGTLVIIDQTGKSRVQKIDANKTADAESLITGIIERYTRK